MEKEDNNVAQVSLDADQATKTTRLNAMTDCITLEVVKTSGVMV